MGGKRHIRGTPIITDKGMGGSIPSPSANMKKQVFYRGEK